MELELVDCSSDAEMEEVAVEVVSVDKLPFSLSVAVAVVVKLVFLEAAKSSERDLVERQGNTEKRMVEKWTVGISVRVCRLF